MSVRVLTGDCRTILATLDAGSVQTCVTSPPYFGLRDYGTAKREGGDAGCNHVSGAARNDAATRNAWQAAHGLAKNKAAANDGGVTYFRDVCGKCGAQRIDAQIGLEPTPDAYVAELVAVFREVRRVLRDDGTVFLNLGDSYFGSTMPGGNKSFNASGGVGGFKQQRQFKKPSGGQHEAACDTSGKAPEGSPANGCLKPKDLIGIPWRVAFALQADGWYLRSDIIWHKPNPMPESVQGSHFTRHMVTLEEYENLSGLPYQGERAGDDWAGDMPRLSEIEIPCRKAPLSAKQEGHSDRTEARRSRGCEGEAPPIQQNRAGQAEQAAVRANTEGCGNTQESDPQISGQRSRQAGGGGAARANKKQPTTNSATASGEPPLHPLGEGHGQEAARLRETEGGNRAGAYRDGRGLDRDCSTEQESVLLLPQEADFDVGSRHPGEQGRSAHQGEHRSGLSKLQQQEEGQDDPPLLVGCPGCSKCERYHGYTFHLSAGRPTKAHEYLFLLTKKPTYYYDADAIAEPALHPFMIHRSTAKTDVQESAYLGNAPTNLGRCGTNEDGTRNRRTVWTVATQPFKGAHFATFPPALIEPCILAGSARQACETCGAPWARETEKTRTFESGSGRAGNLPVGKNGAGLQGGGETGDIRRGPVVHSTTTGWAPTCDHENAGTGRSVVLDPFFGAGTTGLVADRLGRDCIGIELNPAYATMARERITDDAPLFADGDVA